MIGASDSVGHAQAMFDRQARFHAFQRSRGMSEAALSRLPFPPKIEPIGLQGYIATKADAGNLRKQQQARAWAKDRPRRSGRFVSTANSGPRLTEATDEDRARIAAIHDAVAKVFGVTFDSIRWGGSSRVCQARQHAVYLTREATCLTWERLSAFFEDRAWSGLAYSHRVCAKKIGRDAAMEETDRRVRAFLPTAWFPT